VLAWQSTAPGLRALQLNDVPVPQPREGEVLVAVHYATLNVADCLMVEDKYQVRPARPFIPGHEISGIVVGAPPGAHLLPGRRIASELKTGGFAEYAVVKERTAIALPDRVALREAAALPVGYATAMIALAECAAVRPGAKVLVHAAAGGVGLAAVQIAKALGCIVIAAAGTVEKRDLAVRHGADACVDYRQAGWSAVVNALTDDEGVDVVVDTVGGEVTTDSLRCLARGGKLLIVGFASGNIAAIPANRLLLKRASAIGVYWDIERDDDLLARTWERVLELAAAGSIAPVVDDRFAFSQLPAALEHLSSGRSLGRLALRIDRHAAREQP
jgi:NADPH2:quinone reductase